MASEPAALLHRYCRLADSGRVADVAALFLPDGLFEVAGEQACGPGEIEAVLTRMAGRFAAHPRGPSLRHHLTTVVVDEEQDGLATARSYVLVVGSAGLDHWGRYRDRLTLTPSGWRFAHRRAVLDGSVAGSVAEPFVGL